MDGPGIRWTWDPSDMGSDGHGIPSGIDVTFRGIPERSWIPPRIAVTFRGIPSGNERTGD